MFSKSVALQEPPQSNEENIAKALADFQAADEEFTKASAGLLHYLRANPEKTPLVFMNGQPQWRLGALGRDAEFAQLESQCAHALERRNETLRAWSILKVAAENQNNRG